MNEKLRILILEDQPADAELMLREARRAGGVAEWKQVETEADYLAQLDQGWNLILADCNLPQFTGLRALELLKARGLDIPLILVSGAIGEDKVVEVMQAGASDFVMKNQLGRLGPAVERALRAAAERQEHQRTQKTLAQLAMAVNQSAEIIMITDLQGRIQFVNPAFERITGYTRAEVLGQNPRILKSGRQDAAFYRRLWQTITAGQVWSAPCINKRKDGTLFKEEGTISPVRDDQGRITCFLAVRQDVTLRVQAEETLAKSEAKYRQLFESSRDALMTLEPPSWKFTAGNPSAVRMFGAKDEADFISRGPWELSPERQPDGRLSAEKAREMIEIALRDGSHFFEWTHRRIGGADFFADVLLTRMQQDAKMFLQATVRDITEKKQLETRLLRAQRMESLGTLAGGIAHDLNNILAPILMSADLLKKKLHDSNGQQLLAGIKTSAGRGSDLVRQILIFARGMEGRRGVIQMKHIVQEVEKMIRQMFPKSIEIRRNIGKDLRAVLGDPTQLQQVLMNLCVNARDAMPRGGQLEIAVKNERLDESQCALHRDARPGEHVLISVKDTGTGISPENLARIFDPFFTTKEPGRGTGLGLATTLEIVKLHDGFIHVHSKVGEGTTFEVHLPATVGKTAEEPGAIADRLPLGHGELVLVVDDERTIREVVSSTLKGSNYRVLVAADGSEAIAHFAHRDAEIRAVITDLEMPVLNGAATIRIIKKIDPTIKIIAMSGAVGLEAAQDVFQGIKDAVDFFLPKPFTTEALLNGLRKVLDEES